MIKIAIIGLGSMGKNHYRVLKSLEGVKVVALCDVDKTRNYEEPLFLDIDEMLKTIQIDAVIIAVPTFMHKKIALKCLKYKKDLFIEKPVASNNKEAKKIQEKALEVGAKVCIGYIERFNPVVTALKNELKNREIYSIDITRVGPFPPRISDVGILTDLAVHDIDLIRFITEEEIEKVSIFKSRKIHNHHEDNAVLSFKLKNEIIANITTNWLTPFRKRTIEIATKKGYFEADLMEQSLNEYSQYKKNFSYVVRKCIVQKGEPLLKELEAFRDFLLTSDRGNLSSIEDSMITLDISSNYD